MGSFQVAPKPLLDGRCRAIALDREMDSLESLGSLQFLVLVILGILNHIRLAGLNLPPAIRILDATSLGVVFDIRLVLCYG